jgi:dihydrofolate synthase/folylpolyglutamate synthase
LQENAAPVDIAVLEVGLGGRLDATNIVQSALSIITDISLDHTEWLGHTIPEIAREKAGILRPNGILVTLPQHPEANQAIGEAAVALNVRAINAATALPFDTHAVTNTRNRYPLDLVTGKDDGLHIEVDSPLAGQHQQRNIALAITAALELRNIWKPTKSPTDLAVSDQRERIPQPAPQAQLPRTASPRVPHPTQSVGWVNPVVAKRPSTHSSSRPEQSSQYSPSRPERSEVEGSAVCQQRHRSESITSDDSASHGYKITAASIAAGIHQTRWPARLEHLTRGHQHILLDVGHNPAGAWTLRAALAAEAHPPRVIIFGCLDDKPVEELAQILFPLFDRVLLVPVPSPRAASGARLLAAAQSVTATATIQPNLAAALANEDAVEHDAVITGSVYLVGEARGLLIADGWTAFTSV